MNRQTLVNTLLILAGIVLALALFAAGVYWRSRTGSRGGQAEPHVTRARIQPSPLRAPAPDARQTKERPDPDTNETSCDELIREAEAEQS